MKEKNRGITLIVLVITIIVLLILAAVSIATLTGENGILSKAGMAKEDTQKASAKEQAQIDILAWQTEQIEKNESAELNDSIIQEILSNKKDYVKNAGDTSFITAEGEHEITYSELYKTSTNNTPVIFEPETLAIGDAINIDKYGWRVKGYTVTTSEFTTGVWRLFYQDNDYTYLITNECVGSYRLSSNAYNSYTNGSYVSAVGQKLNKKLLEVGTFFGEDNTNANIRAVAWLTDTSDTGMWTEFKNNDAVFAIGSPTVELYKASFDATSSVNKVATFTLEVGTYGYTENTSSGQLQTSYNYGIYNKSNSSNWWLASPCDDGKYSGIIVNGNNSFFSYNNVDTTGIACAVRPVVCIPTSVFNSNYESTLYDE